MPDWKQLANIHRLPLNEAETDRAATSLTNVWRVYEPLAKTLGPMDDPACLLDLPESPVRGKEQRP